MWIGQKFSIDFFLLQVPLGQGMNPWLFRVGGWNPIPVFCRDYFIKKKQPLDIRIPKKKGSQESGFESQRPHNSAIVVILFWDV